MNYLMRIYQVMDKSNKKASISFIFLIIIFGIYYIRADSTSVQSGAYEPLQVAIAPSCLYPSTLMKIDTHDDGKRINLPGKWRWAFENDIWNDFNTSDSFRVPVFKDIETVVGIGSEYASKQFISRADCKLYASNNLEDQLKNDSLLNKIVEIWENESLVVPYEVVKNPTDVEFRLIDKTGLPIDFTYPEMPYPIFGYEKGKMSSVIKFNSKLNLGAVLITFVYNPYSFRTIGLDYVELNKGIVPIENKDISEYDRTRGIFKLILDNYPESNCCFFDIKSYIIYPDDVNIDEMKVYFSYDALGNEGNTSIMFLVSKIDIELGEDNEPTFGITTSKTWFKMINMTVKRW